MTLELERLDTIADANRNQWNNVVEQTPLGCVYHRYGWLRAVEAGTSNEPKHLLVSKKGNPIAVFPNFVTEFGLARRLSSMRPGYGGPLVMSEEETALNVLLDEVPELCGRRTILNEFRTYDQRYVRYHDLLRERGYHLSVLSCRFTLDLSDGWDAVFDGMDSERRRGIRRGHDNEFEILDEKPTEAALSAFYDDYATVMERAGHPVLPRSFLRELAAFDHRLKLFSFRTDGEPRGSYLYLLDDEQSTLQHLFTAVTEEQFEYHAPELLHEHAIKWGIDEGYETYELRGAPTDFRNGVYRFKELFGTKALPVLTWERGRPAPVLSVLNAGRSLYRQYSG